MREDNEIMVGDVVVCGRRYRVERIVSQYDYVNYEKNEICYGIEFYDEHNRYHYWKSEYDGGKLERGVR